VIIGDLAHTAVAVAVYVALACILVVTSFVKVIGVKSTFRRRRPRRQRSRQI